MMTHVSMRPSKSMTENCPLDSTTSSSLVALMKAVAVQWWKQTHILVGGEVNVRLENKDNQ